MSVLPELRERRLAFVDSLVEPELCEEDVAHFRRVLRMKASDLITIGDGRGAWRVARLGLNGTSLEPTGEINDSNSASRVVTVAFAPTKGDRPEWTVQKLTEIGVNRIVAVRTDRSIVNWSGERALRQLVRWKKVSREAAMQSRRLCLPEIEPMVSLSKFVGKSPSLCLCVPGGRRLTSYDATLVIGPEGGFTANELELAEPVDLGTDTVLRTETAAVVAATLVVSGV